MSVVALLHPGAMGARIGGELTGRGHEVRWLSAGRSSVTRDRAATERLTETLDATSLLEGAEYAVSVCPPQGALDVARLVAGAGFTGTYVEANPVSAATLAAITLVVGAGGAALVDAGIVGPPPRSERRTHLYLAGPTGRTEDVAGLFAGSRVTPLTLGERAGAASAAKQAYALFNKGRMVLAAVAADLAEKHGVLDVLTAESHRQGAEILAEVVALRTGLREVGWRWEPELAEIGATLEGVGLDPELANSLAAALRRPAG